MKTEKAKNNFLQAKEGLSPRTLEQYSTALDCLERECPKMPKKPEPIREALNKAPTIWVKHARWRVWRVFFRWCSREYGTPNPMDRVDEPKLPEVEMTALEREELPTVLAAASNLRDRAIVALALDSGVRASEFGRIRILDISTDTVRLWGKGRRQVRVPISPEMRHLIQFLIDHDGHGGPQSLLFTGQDGRPLSRFAVYRIVRRCMERAGIAGPKLGSHCLRHSLGRHFIGSGGDAFTLQRIMRHKNISTTLKYVKLNMDDVVEKHNDHSPVRPALLGAQGSLFSDDETSQAIREAEEIVKGRKESRKP